MTAGEPLTFEGSVPILRVASLEASIAYYVAELGFAVDWQDPGVIGSVSRDKASIMLAEGDQGHPGGWVWIGVTDAESLHEELRARGARIPMPLTNFYWALEFHVEDIDGNVLRFGSDSKEGVPFGPWIDMKERAWRKESGGGWQQDHREGGR